MIRPTIQRTSAGSSGEKIIEMITSRLSRVDLNMNVYRSGADEVTIVAKKAPENIKNYIRRKVSQL